MELGYISSMKVTILPQFRALLRALMTAEVGGRAGVHPVVSFASEKPCCVLELNMAERFIGHKFESVSTTRQAEGFYRMRANAAVVAVVERGRDTGRP